MDERFGNRRDGRLFLGVLVLALGVALLVDRLGFWDIGGIGRLWPLFILAPGVSGMLSKGPDAGNVVLVTLGTLFLLQNYARISFAMTWPLIIVAVGIGLIVEAMSGRFSRTDRHASRGDEEARDH